MSESNSIMPPTSVETLLTTQEVAAACKVDPRTVARWVYPKGQLRATRLGRAVRFAPSELRRFLASLETGRDGHDAA